MLPNVVTSHQALNICKFSSANFLTTAKLEVQKVLLPNHIVVGFARGEILERVASTLMLGPGPTAFPSRRQGEPTAGRPGTRAED